jgi:hypothetical protein
MFFCLETKEPKVQASFLSSIPLAVSSSQRNPDPALHPARIAFLLQPR